MQGVVGQVGVEQLEQPGVGRVGGALGEQHGERVHALAQVRSGRLARLVRVAGDVEDVVGELEGRPDHLAVLRERLLHLARGTGEAGAVAGGGGDERAGLAGHDAQVVLERVEVARADGLEDLTLDEAAERLGLDAHRVGAEPRGELRGLGEQVVAGEDRDGVVPAGVRGVGAAAQRSLVHHVVVVERSEVGQLDHARGGDDALRVGVAGLRGEQDEQRAEPLAARLHQVLRGLGDEPDLALDRGVELHLDLLEAAAQPVLEIGVEDRQRQRGRGGGGHDVLLQGTRVSGRTVRRWPRGPGPARVRRRARPWPRSQRRSR